jgi:chitinase
MSDSNFQGLRHRIQNRVCQEIIRQVTCGQSTRWQTKRRVDCRAAVILAAAIAVQIALSPAILAQVPAWAPNTHYAIGARVTYQGVLYQCQQAHTSIVTWEPPNTPALWLVVSGGGGGDTQAPTAPTNLRVTGSTPSSVSLAWNAASDDVGVSGYDVLRNGAVIGGGGATSFTAAGLAANTSFAFTVRARDAAGNVSAQSNQVTGATQPAAGDTQAPTAPTNLRATAATSSSVSLAWNASTDNVGVVRYDVLQNGTKVGGGAATSFTATGFAPNTSFSFTVRAADAAGNLSALSNQITARTQPAADTQAPAAPANLRVTIVTSTSVALAWDASTDNVGVAQYEVLQNGASIGGGPATNLTVTALAPGTSFTFRVRAKDAAGNLSALSNQVTATTQAGGGGGGQVPKHALIGYWHNFDNGSGFIRLRDVSRDFDVIDVSFGEPAPGSRSTIQFIPDTRTSAAEIQADVAQLKSEGKKVLLSIGGANGLVELLTEADRQNFINSVSGLLTQYGFNGIDIDFEGSSVILNAGDSDFRSPTTPKIINLISAARAIADRVGPNFVLSMAPETFYVQVGYQAYGGGAGAYLPVIYGLRDKLSFIHVQLYNTGTVAALDGQIYGSGTADFQVAMAEMLLQGFPVGGNPNLFFPALREDQVAIGVPATTQAAGSGYAPPAEIVKALNYLVLGRPFGGRYILRKAAGYPNFRGVMTWSINWDRFAGFGFSRGVRPALNSLP